MENNEDQDLRFIQAQSVFMVQEHDKNFQIIQQEVIRSGDIIKIKHQMTKHFVYSISQNYKNLPNQNKKQNLPPYQVLFTLDSSEFDDSQFIIYKLNQNRNMIDKFKFLESEQDLGEIINNGDDIVLKHKKTQNFVFIPNTSLNNNINNTQGQQQLISAPITPNQFLVSCTNDLIQQNNQLQKFIFTISDINYNFHLENMCFVNLISKMNCLNLHSHHVFLNEDLQQYELSMKHYEQQFEDQFTFQLQLANQTLQEARVPIQKNVYAGDIIVIKHLTSGCVIGINKQSINKQHKTQYLVAKNTSEDTVQNSGDNSWQINIEYFEEQNNRLNDRNLNPQQPEQIHVQHKDIISLKGIIQDISICSNKICPVTQIQTVELLQENETNESDQFQIQIESDCSLQKLCMGSIFKLKHVNTDNFLHCQKQIHRIDEDGNYQNISNNNNNFSQSSSDSSDGTNKQYNYAFQVFCSQNNDQNSLFQIVDIKSKFQ